MPRPTRGPRSFLPVRGCHPLWPDFPDGSGSYLSATGLVRVRSPLLAESRLMSFPPGTEMFQFPGFASAAYGFSGGSPIAGRGCPIRKSSDQSLLAAPQGLSQRATSFIASWRQGIHQMPLLSSTPTSDNRSHQGGCKRPRAGSNSSDYYCYKCRRRSPERRAASIPMPNMRAAADRKKKAVAHDLPAPAVPRRMTGSLRPCPHDGHFVTTSRCPRNTARHRRTSEGQGQGAERGVASGGRAPRPGPRGSAAPKGSMTWWAWADLNGRPHAYQACALTS